MSYHIMSSHQNLLPFIILGSLVLMRRDGIRAFLTLSAASSVVAGTIVWCVGRDIQVSEGCDDAMHVCMCVMGGEHAIT